MSAEAETYGPEFTLSYSTLIGDVWGSDAEEAKLIADPTRYAKEKGLPVEAGAVVRLDRSQPDGLLKRSELVRGWSETPGIHILFVPDFALTNIRPYPGSDIARALDFDEPISQQARDQVATAKARLGHMPLDRPWLGGVDTPHTFMYHDRHGTEILDRLRRALVDTGEDGPPWFVINGRFIETPDSDALSAYVQIYGSRVKTQVAGRRCFRRADGNIFLLSPAMSSFIELFAEPATLSDARAEAWLLSDATAASLWEKLILQGVIRRVLPAQPQAALATAEPG